MGVAETYVDVTDHQPDGFVSLPNGLGLDYLDSEDSPVKVGVAPNELTDSNDQDFLPANPGISGYQLALGNSQAPHQTNNSWLNIRITKSSRDSA